MSVGFFVRVGVCMWERVCVCGGKRERENHREKERARESKLTKNGTEELTVNCRCVHI